MSAATDIVLYDGLATPTAHTFTPYRKDKGVVFYAERDTAATPLGFFILSISQSVPKTSSPVIRSKINFVLPREVQDSSTGLYSYQNIGRVSIEFTSPTGDTTDHKKDMVAYASNLLAAAVVSDLVVNNLPPY
jgi:hypothetical protein